MKKGYFYTLDAVIGIIILLIGLFVIAGYYFQTPDKERTESIADDITNLFVQIKVGDICTDISDCDCSYTSMEAACNENLIDNPDMTLMELFGLLYSQNRKSNIEAIINDTIIHSAVLPEHFGMQVIIDDHKTGGNAQLFPLVTP